MYKKQNSNYIDLTEVEQVNFCRRSNGCGSTNSPQRPETVERRERMSTVTTVTGTCRPVCWVYSKSEELSPSMVGSGPALLILAVCARHSPQRCRLLPNRTAGLSAEPKQGLPHTGGLGVSLPLRQPINSCACFCLG